MVLDKDSSILGYPGEISKSLDADHHNVCKYSSTQDHNYIAVCNALRDVVCRVRNAGEFFRFLHLFKTVPCSTLTDQRMIDAQYSQYSNKIEKLLLVSADIQLCKSTFTKWITHPTLKDYLLAFTVSSVTIYRWADLTEVTSVHYAKSTSHLDETHQQQTSVNRLLAPKLEVIAAQTEFHVLVQIYDPPGGRGDLENHLYLFPSSSLDPHIPPGSSVEPWAVPPIITSQIYILLGVLSSSRLIFFDKDHWMCSWRVGAELRDRGHIRSQSGLEMVQKHFFLPRDWVTVESLSMCRVLEDGKVLFPNNGEVAIIRSGLNNAW